MREDDGRAGKGRQEKRKTWAGQFLIHPPTSRSPAPSGPCVNVSKEEGAGGGNRRNEGRGRGEN